MFVDGYTVSTHCDVTCYLLVGGSYTGETEIRFIALRKKTERLRSLNMFIESRTFIDNRMFDDWRCFDRQFVIA